MRFVDAGVIEKSCSVKVAVVDAAALIVTMHVPVPEQDPPQPVKFEFTSAAADNITDVALRKLAEHAVPQAMPAGLLLTFPPPVPAIATASKYTGLNVAVTDSLAFMVTEQVGDRPEQPPLQPAKPELLSGVAVRVTVEAPAKLALHPLPQSIPKGELVIMPAPVPLSLTDR